MADLHIVTEHDIAAAESRDWAGPAVPAGHIVQTGYVQIHDIVCHAPYGHQLLPAEVERAYRRQLEQRAKLVVGSVEEGAAAVVM